jgi:hypothetical protein
MFRFSKLLLAMLALVLLTFFAAPLAMADTIVIGGTNSPNAFPFGAGAGPYTYQAGGEYQQIYNSARFSGPVMITQIAFASSSVNRSPGTNIYNFRLGLGTTSSTPGSPNSSFAANGTTTTVFNGPLTAVLTTTNSFDLRIPLTTPFTYDPAGGNLLLDVVLNSQTTGNVTFFVAGRSSDVGRVFLLNGNGTPAAQGNYGLYTQFTTEQAVPEPTTILLLGTGLAGIAAKVRHRRKNTDH